MPKSKCSSIPTTSRVKIDALPSDHKWMKWMVASIFVIGTLNSAVSAYTAYDYAVTDFGMLIDLSILRFQRFAVS